MDIFNMLNGKDYIDEKVKLQDKLDELLKQGVIKNYSFHDSVYLEVDDDEMFFKTRELDEYIEMLEMKGRIRTNKATCACGNELTPYLYKGYYDSFVYLYCDNETCDYMDKLEQNEKELKKT